MSIVLAMSTDGRREFLEQTVDSITASITGAITSRVMWDDSGDPNHRAWLKERYEPDGWFVWWPASTRVGYSEARRMLFAVLSGYSERYVAGWEDDFLVNFSVNLDDLAAILDANPHLAQVALLRAACYPKEIEAEKQGRPLGWSPRSFRARKDEAGRRWVEHRNYWTSNPGLFPIELTKRRWPGDKSSERVFGDTLLAEHRRFAHYGWLSDPRALTHIGTYRTGSGY